MANYFEVHNDSNIVTIDDTYKNLSFVRKYQNFGSINISNTSNAYPSTSNFFRINNRRCLIILPKNNGSLFAIKSSNPNIFFYSENKQTYTDIHFYSLSGEEINNLMPAITIYEYQDVDAPPTNIGLEVRGENGNIIYSTSQRMLKVIDFSLEYREGINPAIDSKPATYYNKNIAVVIGSPQYFLIAEPNRVYRGYEGVYMPSQNSFAMKWIFIGQNPAQGMAISGARNILIVDITGL